MASKKLRTLLLDEPQTGALRLVDASTNTLVPNPWRLKAEPTVRMGVKQVGGFSVKQMVDGITYSLSVKEGEFERVDVVRAGKR